MAKSKPFAKSGEPECPTCGAGWCQSVDERHLLAMADGRNRPVREPYKHWVRAEGGIR